MPPNYAYRTYRIAVPPEKAISRLRDVFTEKDFTVTGGDSRTISMKYPYLRFSSAKPLTCISTLVAEARTSGAETEVRVGLSFTRIKWYTIFVMGAIAFVLPAVLGILQDGRPDVPPMSFIAIPLGVMVHYHVRWRAFRAVARIMQFIGRT